jgi:hypothetical protein
VLCQNIFFVMVVIGGIQLTRSFPLG